MTFPNMASNKDCDTVLRQELLEAGISILDYSIKHKSEVPYNIYGKLGPWTFTRAWYYWVAKGPGIPIRKAEILHEKFGKEVRVDGDCSCPSPRRNQGFGIGLYHVDTQIGLNALADLIKEVISFPIENY